MPFACDAETWQTILSGYQRRSNWWCWVKRINMNLSAGVVTTRPLKTGLSCLDSGISFRRGGKKHSNIKIIGNFKFISG
jgi:hypothetical protein